jgi:hypothetical protein
MPRSSFIGGAALQKEEKEQCTDAQSGNFTRNGKRLNTLFLPLLNQ